MRKIILSHICLYFVFSKAYALPLLWVVPFVFDLGILLFTFLSGAITSLIFILLKKIKICIFIMVVLWIISFWYLINLIWIKSFLDINLDFYISFWYFYIISIVFFIFYLFYILDKDFKIYLLIFFIFILWININLINEVLILKNEYDSIITNINSKVDKPIVFTADTILNNIIASGEFKYYYKWIEDNCRVSVSFHQYEEKYWSFQKKAKKDLELNMYIWVSVIQENGFSLCKNMIDM